jgi:hypothetical protein
MHLDRQSQPSHRAEAGRRSEQSLPSTIRSTLTASASQRSCIRARQNRFVMETLDLSRRRRCRSHSLARRQSALLRRYWSSPTLLPPRQHAGQIPPSIATAALRSMGFL